MFKTESRLTNKNEFNLYLSGLLKTRDYDAKLAFNLVSWAKQIL